MVCIIARLGNYENSAEDKENFTDKIEILDNSPIGEYSNPPENNK